MKFKRFLAIAIFSLLSFQGHATHLLGGEIVWKCKPNGKYQFFLTIYRECGSGFVGNLYNAQSLSTNFGTTISCAYISTVDVVPTCYTGSEICAPGASGTGRMQKFSYRSGDIVLAGSPPVGGWSFGWYDFARPASVQNLAGAGGLGYYLRATMYPYTPPGSITPLSGGTAANPTCYDSSPNFLEDPQVVACANQDVVYNNLGYDPDLDSLHYFWANPLTTAAGASAPWAPGYSTTNQLPSSAGSTAAVLDSDVGTITFNSALTGSFATCVGIEAWRCNQLVGEIYRDIPVFTRTCLPPTGASCAAGYNPVPPEFYFTTDSSLAVPTILSPVTNIVGDTVAYRTEGFPGDTIRFTMRAVDPYVHPDCTPQKISMEARGGNLSSAANYNNANTCLFNPPCATIVPTGTSTSLTNVSGTLDAKFNWFLECNHLFYQEYICGSLKSDYEFYFKISDDQCPVPLTAYAKLLVKVKNYMPGIPNIDNTCIQQDDNGVTFDWVNNPDTGFNWDFYIINHIDTLGNTSVVDTIYDWATQTYTHTGADPNAVNGYTIQVGGGCGLLSDPSPVLQNIRVGLQAFPPPPNSSIAQIDWNPWMRGNDSTSYDVWVEAPISSGNWTQLGTTMDTTWTDTVAFCGEWLNYEVRYGASCVSSSDSGFFSDKTPPAPIVFDSVTVAGGNLAAMSWEASSDSDVVYYRIYRRDNSGFLQPVDSILASDYATSMPYIYQLSNAENESEEYVITAIDSCGNQSSVGNTIPSSTMYLFLGIDPCDGYARVRWNTYKTWTQTQPKEYNLYCDITDPLGGVISGVLLKGGTLDTTFNHYGIINGYSYCYYVRAVDTTGTITSTSNKICNSSAVVQGSKVLYLGRASVTSQNGIDLYAYIDKDADVIDYQIQRADAEIGPYLTIGNVAKPALGPWEVKFIDYTADPLNRKYFYRIASRDSCGALDTLSNLGTNMLLDVEAIGNLSNTLTWTHYREFDAGVEEYKIYRSIDGGSSFALAATTTDSVYNDDIKPYSNSKGKFCYYIKAIAKDGLIPWRDEFGEKFNARSNVACAVHKARLWVPSAFSPNSDVIENRKWKPQGVFARPDSYTLLVMNRWGQEVFRTSDLNESWDGKVNGDPAAIGIYTYYIKYRSIEDVPVEERGTFTILN
jgi:gliding motility-associated-like protein